MRRRRTYLEAMVGNYDKIHRGKKSFREKLEGISSLYAEAIVQMDSCMSQSERLNDKSYQEANFVSTFCEQFLNGKAKVYKIAQTFGEHLMSAPLDVLTEMIPKKLAQTYLIEFPDSIEFTGPAGEIMHNAIVTFGLFGDKYTFQIMTSDVAENYTIASIVVMDISTKTTIGESLDYFYQQKYGNLDIPPDMINYLAKCLLYIESGEPDLKNDGKMSESRKPKKDRALLSTDTFPYPIVRVGYSFHGRTYTKGSTVVRGFFRWQPYGPKLSMVKLLWIDSHERKFKND